MSKSQASTEYELNKPVPYILRVGEDLLSVTKQKLQLARFPEELDDLADDDWSQGAKVKVVRDLANYWRTGFDWRAEEVLIPPLYLVVRSSTAPFHQSLSSCVY